MAIAVLLDTNVLLNAKNSSELYSAYSLQILDAIEEGTIHGIISVISIAELSTGYYLHGDRQGKEELLAHLISTKDFVIVELDMNLADMAAQIRADTGLKLPDSIIIATGLAKGAQYLITHDKELKKVSSKYIETVSSKEFLSRFKHAKKK